MSLYKNAATFDTLRSASSAAIGANYAAVGSALPSPAVVLTFKNATNGDVYISTNGVDNMLYLPANSFNVFDVRTNSPTYNDLMFKEGTVFYAKDGPTASTLGTFYIEAVIVVRQ
jgi:hypothetical protein